LNVPELVGYPLIVLAGVVDDDRQQERLVSRHQMRPIDRELPLETEIPLLALVGVSRDDRDE